MEVWRSRHGKTALAISGNAMVKILGITANGPKFDMMPRQAFQVEYNAVSAMSVEAALFSFLGVAKRAYRHDQAVVNFLWEQIVSKSLSEMSLAELVLVYNSIAKSVGKQPRKSFESKSAAMESIAKLDALVKRPTPEQEKAEIVQQSKRSRSMTDNVEKKPRGKGIGARACELILEGKSTAEVIETIKAEIEGANPTPATIAWYKNKLRADGKLEKAVRKTKAAEVEAE